MALLEPDVNHDRADIGVDVSVLVVTFNSMAYIEDCLGALPAALAAHSYEVIVVDNASCDGTPALVRAGFPHGVVLANTTNRGFARANNQGIAMARGRQVLLLNPDTRAAPGSLDRLVRLLDRDPVAGVVAPGLRNPDGSDQRTSRAFPTPAAAVFGRRSPLTRWFPGNRWSRRYLPAATGRGSAPYHVDWVSGACLMVPRRVLDTVGGLDPDFFLYWEDADWCRRIKAAGWSVVCDPVAVVVHDEGVQRARPARQQWLFHRSAYRYYAKHHLGGSAGAARVAVAAGLYSRAVALIAGTALRRVVDGRSESATAAR